ncbi:pyridoxal 5'-phosphate synthase glutaminase subunit PdxT [Fusobacterium perfoetens]|uniref:pyridoxal 5'-phosphate synthase glutaminase subunit PdxT n=1 Tax=Fusobacterium perfoetens TaxID=852 RepID=UPI001F2A9180|nr:pyridoxal 5'-phosphate synthase glutaminase subunit PdxT [Fusobacterium perfoetens]MCF2626024.1 pyridoxal 5'-phosphate synthase glutaminase subunit PdxT [Fusobacterium perfoetens]
MRIGILALQGAFLEHKNILDTLGVENIYVKTKQDLENIDGIILPGGESTAMGKLLRDFDILNILKEKVERGFPVFGTCSGMILLAKELVNDETKHLSTMNISVKRNAYGRQLGSFKTHENFKGIDEKVEMTFIRAPYVEKVGEGVEILAKVDDKIVAVKEKNMLAISFHPELTKDLSVHKYFLKMVKTFLPKV